MVTAAATAVAANAAAATAATAAAVGSLKQRLSQLREAYDFVTHTNGVPPYKVRGGCGAGDL
jgi:hypothetical protein